MLPASVSLSLNVDDDDVGNDDDGVVSKKRTLKWLN